MYNEEEQCIISRLEEFIIEKGSQNKAAELIGISAAILTPLRKGTYKGDVQAYLKKIANYFDIKDDFAETYKEIDYVQTSISSKVYDVIRICHVKGGLAIFSGDAGIGKTKAAQKYVQDNPLNSIYVTVNPCLTSIKSVLKMLAVKLGANIEKTLDELWLAISEKLSDGMVLIFDEAQHLPIKTIETLRSFSDYFASKGQTVGIVFVGNQETVRRLGSKQKAEFAQISNRTKQKLVYTTKNIKREDIKLLFPVLLSKGMEVEIDFLLGVSQTHQALRGAVNLFSNAYDNNNYTLKGLVAMAKFMELDLTGLDLKKLASKEAA